jgi:hypothetical protein
MQIGQEALLTEKALPDAVSVWIIYDLVAE